jgi:hypothetical protein
MLAIEKGRTGIVRPRSGREEKNIASRLATRVRMFAAPGWQRGDDSQHEDKAAR